MLLNCNALSANRLKMASDDFKKHSKLLGEMKKDLDYIFKKIRLVKAKISVQYPEVYAAVEPKSRQSLAEEAEDDEPVNSGPMACGGKDATTGGEFVEKEEHKCSSSSSNRAGKLSDKKKSSSSGSGTKGSIDYVQIAEQSPVDVGLLNVTDEVTHKRRSLGSNRSTSTDNDSSDCTSDTNWNSIPLYYHKNALFLVSLIMFTITNKLCIDVDL